MPRIVFKSLVWKRVVIGNITESRWFWKRLSRSKVPNNHFLKQFRSILQIDFLKNSPTEKYLCWSLSNKVADLKVGNFIKKRLQHRCFLVNIAKFLKTAFFIEHFWWLVLSVWWSNCSCIGHLPTCSFSSKTQYGMVFAKKGCRSVQSMSFRY